MPPEMPYTGLMQTKNRTHFLFFTFLLIFGGHILVATLQTGG
jgi:hypothetical protein